MGWKSDEWKLFLKNSCTGYRDEDIDTDANFLANTKLDPSEFKTLIEIYERDSFESFRQHFPNFALGNLLRLINGLKGHVDKQEVSPKKIVSVGPKSAGGPPNKKPRLVQNIDWLNKVNKYMLFFNREDKENFPRRCACVISPTIAVTFAHGGNKKFKARQATNKGDMIEKGSILKLYFLYGDENQQGIEAEVVVIDQCVDFILLEALSGKTFFDGKIEENILEDPVDGIKLLAIGLSSDTKLQIAVQEGSVTSTGPFENRRMVSDIIAWAGGSGGGLFSPNNKLLGIVTHSYLSDEYEPTRTYFVPATEIRDALKMFMQESGKIAEERHYLRRSME